MKNIFSFISVLFLTIGFATAGFAQSKVETEVLQLSNKMFNWEVENKIDSLNDLFHPLLKIINSKGDIQNKEQYLKTLTGGNFKHDSIHVEQSQATVVNKTATVIGKGQFYMTVSDKKVHRHLSYMEVFIREDKEWKLLALYASVIPE